MTNFTPITDFSKMYAIFSEHGYNPDIYFHGLSYSASEADDIATKEDGEEFCFDLTECLDEVAILALRYDTQLVVTVSVSGCHNKLNFHGVDILTEELIEAERFSNKELFAFNLVEYIDLNELRGYLTLVNTPLKDLVGRFITFEHLVDDKTKPVDERRTGFLSWSMFSPRYEQKLVQTRCKVIIDPYNETTNIHIEPVDENERCIDESFGDDETIASTYELRDFKIVGIE